MFGDPNHSSTTEEHFDLLQDQWLRQMEYLRRQVDEAIPSDEFIKACGLSSSSLLFSLQIKSFQKKQLFMIHNKQKKLWLI